MDLRGESQQTLLPPRPRPHVTLCVIPSLLSANLFLCPSSFSFLSPTPPPPIPQDVPLLRMRPVPCGHDLKISNRLFPKSFAEEEIMRKENRGM